MSTERCGRELWKKLWWTGGLSGGELIEVNEETFNSGGEVLCERELKVCEEVG